MPVGTLTLSCLGVMIASVWSGPADLVDTRLGTAPNRGSCLLGPCVPHGSAYPSPDTEWPSAGHTRPPPSGYSQDAKVVGFSQLHTQGTGGVPSYGLFRVSFGRPSELDIVEAHPYLFRGILRDLGISVSVSATAHGAIYEHSGGKASIDHLCKIGSACASSNATIRTEGDACWGGGTYSGNWNPAPYECWFYATQGKGVLRIAVSFKSISQAKAYHDGELEGRTLADIALSAKELWNDKLSAIRIDGGSGDRVRAFYTHCFHALVQPRDRTADGIGWDDHYTLWDTWKTLYPLLTIIDPDAASGIVNDFAVRFVRSGVCESCYTQGKEYKVGQGGDEADCVIADAVAKDLAGIDKDGLLRLLDSRGKGRTSGYRIQGYVADGERDGYCWRMKSGSGTMSFAYQDYCAGKAIASIRGGQDQTARLLLERSKNWTNVWNSSACDVTSGYRGFSSGRTKDGQFLLADPRKGFNTSFYEATGWEYSFFVPHDMETLISLCGGREAFVGRLEYALSNRLICFGNEPSFQTPWLFTDAGRPELSSKWAHEVLRLFPREGCPGDDDSGAMGSFYVFLTGGLMPRAGTDVYWLHAPTVERMVFNLASAKRPFVISAPGASLGRFRYTRILLNEKPLKFAVLRHSDILAGGNLRFELD